MRIIIDAMSGDNAPKEIVTGALSAVAEFGCEILLTGDENVIMKTARDAGLDIDALVENKSVEILHTTEAINMEDGAFSFRTKKDASMTVGLKSLKDGLGDAFVSAGNTGALYAGASLIVSRIKGCRKAALAAMLPYQNPVLLIDSGANLSVCEDDLEQFALTGSLYMERVIGMKNPRIGLLNNGTEKTKGTETLQNAYSRLVNNKNLNFIGNVESKTLPFGVCDVLVADGFSGNIVLKLTEGLGDFIFKRVKRVFKLNIGTKIAGALVKSNLRKMKNEFDPSESGGAPILGILKPVVKSHGSADALAVKNAIKYAIKYAQSNIIEEISKKFDNADVSMDAKKESENDVK